MKYRITFDEYGAFLESQKESSDIWSQPRNLDVNNFINLLKAEKTFTDTNKVIPNLFAITSTPDSEYVYFMYHNDNDLFKFKHENEEYYLYIPYIYFKWEILLGKNGSKTITATYIGISKENPTTSLAKKRMPRVFHFDFFNVYSGSGKICWGTYNYEGERIENYLALEAKNHVFLNQIHNNDLADPGRIREESFSEIPSETVLSNLQWEEQYIVGDELTNFWIGG